MTTNCISEPKSSYHDRIWTTGEVRLACFSAAATLSAEMPHCLLRPLLRPNLPCTLTMR